MNWIVFIALSWVAFGLEMGLKAPLTLHAGSLTLAPSFVIPLVVFVAMGAAPHAALWACLGAGLMMDLLTPRATLGGTLATIIGPNALGFLVAGQLVLTLRALVIRRNPLSLAFLSLAFALVAGIVATFLLSARRLIGDPLQFSASRELMDHLVSSGMIAIGAFFLALILLPLAPVLGVSGIGPRPGPSRGGTARGL